MIFSGIRTEELGNAQVSSRSAWKSEAAIDCSGDGRVRVERAFLSEGREPTFGRVKAEVSVGRRVGMSSG